MKTFLAKLGLLILLLPACSPMSQGSLSTPTPAPTMTETESAVSLATGVPATAIVITVVPGFIGSLPPAGTILPPPTGVPSTPIPTLRSGSPPTVLKYRILEQFPDLFYCDPDLYPVARDNQMELARERFPALQANQEEFNAILAFTHLTDVTAFSDEQVLIIYQEHKKLAAVFFELAADEYKFQLQIEEPGGQGFLVKGRINGDGEISVDSKEPNFPGCPICLAAHTLIDTPQGAVSVENLRIGDRVWTADSSGSRQLAVIINTGKTLVPVYHQVIHLVLNDGRELWASPGHPLPGGLALQDLQPGDNLDGAIVVGVQHSIYHQAMTYDLLPSGETGFYWANGILVGSSLAEK